MQNEEIYEYQSALRRIAQIDGILPLIAADGIFGAETENATRAFQRYIGLPITGIADALTWQAVMSAQKRAEYELSPGMGIYPFPFPAYITKEGEKSDFVLIIQLLLSAVAVVYDDFEDIEKSGVYDRKTSDAVRRFQKVNRLPETGEVNKATWDKLARSFNIFSENGDYTG